MSKTLMHTVTAAEQGMVLRDLIRRELGVSAKLLARIKRIPGGIRLNGRPVFVNVNVCAGDVVEIAVEHMSAEGGNIIPTPGELDIRYEDEDVLVVNKPAGIPVSPAIGRIDGSLGNIVVWHYMQRGEDVVYRPVNRLDNGTSGLMAIAKNSYAHTALAHRLHTGQFKRRYTAVVHGNFDCEQGSVEAPIARESGSVLKRCVDKDGKWAKTNYTVIEEYNGYSLLSLELESGRTHQIRVHMSHIKHPLVGDFLYGEEENELISRFALHSSDMEFVHPISGRLISLSCEVPEDMQQLIKKLR